MDDDWAVLSHQLCFIFSEKGLSGIASSDTRDKPTTAVLTESLAGSVLPTQQSTEALPREWFQGLQPWIQYLLGSLLLVAILTLVAVCLGKKCRKQGKDFMRKGTDLCHIENGLGENTKYVYKCSRAVNLPHKPH